MSVDTSHTTARFSALVIDRLRCCRPDACSVLHLASCIAETQRQHRSFKPDLPIQHSQLRDPRVLTTSAIRRATLKSR